MRNLQRGLSAIGGLVLASVAAGLGYFAYDSLTGADEGPTCKSAYNSCMQSCRRASTEAPQAQACQDGCSRDMSTCERAGSEVRLPKPY